MKSSLHSLVLFLPLIVLPSRCEKEDSVHIPDDAFRTALIELGVDRDGNGAIDASEAEGITCLDLSGKGISDMTGIQAFINLDLSGIPVLDELSLRDMPRLRNVCISGTTLPEAGFGFDTAGSPNITFTTECSQ